MAKRTSRPKKAQTPIDADRSNAQESATNETETVSRRGALADSDASHQVGTDLHDSRENDAQQGARYDARMGDGEDVQEGARAGDRTPMANSREAMDADRNASDNVSYTGDNFSGSDMPGQYQSSVPGEGLTETPPRNSGTGETDASTLHRRSNTRSATNIGDEGFSDSITPAQGEGAVRVDPQGDFVRADTEQTQADHFRDARSSSGDRASAPNTQAEHFQQERHAQSQEGGYLGMANTSSMNDMSNMRTVAAVFHNWDDATRAVNKLRDAGFDDDHIGIARLDNEKGKVRQVDTSGEVKDDAEKVAGGVATGAAVGGVAGLLAALASLAIPGVGPIVAGGVLATTFGTAAGTAIASAGVGAGIGAAAGGLVGALTSLGLSEDEARYYENDIRSGSTLVTVRAENARSDDAIRMLQQMGGETRSRMSGQGGSNTDPNWRFG